jgi:hypothetical protein
MISNNYPPSPNVFPRPSKRCGKNSPRKTPFSPRKTALRKTLQSKNLENKRKTTRVVLEKGKITLENTTVSQEFVKAMISESIKKD